ncbi:MAG: efflux RND transporter periplasmic adaptor subunit [Gemmataceae bacterium]|nr:efflux RND transporter periplasmic adaptor subunit [Gemmataceae bacterium]
MRTVIVLAVVAAAGAGGYATRDRWVPTLFPVAKDAAPESDDHAGHADAGPSEQILLTAQAQKNLRLTSRPLKAEAFWKTISVPGMVIDRPGFSDRGVVAPVTGVVSRIHKVAGDTARPGEVLFTLKLLSESLHQTQTDLFKATQDIKLAEAQKKRLKESAGAVPEARIIEVDNQIIRLETAVKAYRQELLNRGLPPDQIDGVAGGTFVSEIPILVPTRTAALPLPAPKTNPMTVAPVPPAFEVQELKVELGQQVLAGQTLCLLANHQMLAVEGRAFRDESSLLERVVKEGWPVGVDFEEEPGHGWGDIGQTFHVTYIANTIDADSRTFRFLMPLDNQSRTVEKDGRAQSLWRFRPGQRVRLLVRVERLDNVFVLPADAVARDGADAYVFRQNGDIFDRKPVQVVYRDRQQVVVANDGSVPPGIYVIQTGAAQLNRMVKSQSGTAPKGFHIHADGSVHMGKH